MLSVEEAKRVIRLHEDFVAAENMSGILSNMAEDAVFLAPDSPLIEGHAGLRALYDALFQMGRWEFGHDYSFAEVVGDFVMLHGVARGALTPSEGEPVPIANNFMITMRDDGKGNLKVWRAAFAPSGE